MTIPQHLVKGHKSTFSAEHTDCVFVQVIDGMVHVTNTNRPADAPQRFTFAEWGAFTLGAKAGEFDLDA